MRRRRHLFAGFGGSGGVLDVDVADVVGEDGDRLDRVASAVEDHVRRVEVHSDAGPIESRQELAERFGGFLSGFKTNVDFLGGKPVGDQDDAITGVRRLRPA